MRYLDDDGWPLDEDENRLTALDFLDYAMIESEADLLLGLSQEWLSDPELRCHYQQYADFEADEIALWRRCQKMHFDFGTSDSEEVIEI